MNVRRLNREGLLKMEAFLDSLTTETPMEWPEHLLSDDGATDQVTPPIQVEQRTFGDRFELGEYLNTQLGGSGLQGIEGDRGLWAWLSLFYFQCLAPLGKQGVRKVGERARWIPAIGNFRKYYRHLLAGPFMIYRAHRDKPDRARVLLANPPHTPGEPAEQLAAYQELITNKAIVEAATALYVDPQTGRYKRGASGKGGGTPRRLVEVLQQFDITWDLYSMSAQSLLAMLPPEFRRFQEG